MDLLARVPNVEPSEAVLLEFGDGVRYQAEGVAVEGLGEVERLGGHEHVYVGYGGDHRCGCF